MRFFSLFGLVLLLSLESCTPSMTKEGSTATPNAASPAVIALPGGKTASLTRTPGDPLYSFESLNDSTGVIFKPPTPVESGSPILFVGWAVDQDQKSPAGGVDVVIDGKPFGADYGLPRPDVAGYFKEPAYKNSGFRLSASAGAIPKGQHEVNIRVVSADGKRYQDGKKVQFEVK